MWETFVGRFYLLLTDLARDSARLWVYLSLCLQGKGSFILGSSLFGQLRFSTPLYKHSCLEPPARLCPRATGEAARRTSRNISLLFFYHSVVASASVRWPRCGGLRVGVLAGVGAVWVGPLTAPVGRKLNTEKIQWSRAQNLNAGLCTFVRNPSQSSPAKWAPFVSGCSGINFCSSGR